MKKNGKKEMQIRHALRRAQERYGQSFTREDLLIISQKIRDGMHTIIQRPSRRCTLCDICYMGNGYRVVYDHRTKTVVTFLLPETVFLDDEPTDVL